MKRTRRHTYIAALLIVILLAGVVLKLLQLFYKMLEKKNKKNYHHELTSKILMHWMRREMDGASIASYLENQGIHTVAIYGMGHLGKMLCDALKKTDVIAKYAVDIKYETTYYDIDIIGWDFDWPKVDAVIYTPVTGYSDRRKEIEEKVGCPVLLLEDIVMMM